MLKYSGIEIVKSEDPTDDIFNQLIELNEISISPEVLQEHLKYLDWDTRKAILREVETIGPKGKATPIPIDEIEQKALIEKIERSLKIKMIVQHIAEEHKLHGTDDELEIEYERLAKESNLGLNQVQRFYRKQNRLLEDQLRLSYTVKKVIQFLVDTGRVKIV